MLERLTRFRRDLHRIPELDFDLPETTAYVRRVLETLDCDILSPEGTGLCAWFDAGKASSVAFRTDMDALPITEQTGAAFASLHPGKMHACGHDGHMAMMLEFAHYVNDVKAQLTKNVLLVFQPAEETTGGARLICESGIFRQKRVEAIWGCHLWPDLPQGVIASRPGPLLAASREVTVTFEGKSAHIAKSEEGADAVLAAARVVTGADALLTELRKNEGPWCTLKFGHLTAGTVRNAIAASAKLEGSLRVFSDEAIQKAWQGMEGLARKISDTTGVQISIAPAAGYPAVINDAALYRKTLEQVPDIRELEKPLLIAEDFAFYQKTLPGVFLLLGTGTGVALHSDRFNFDESVLAKGVEMWQKLLPLARQNDR